MYVCMNIMYECMYVSTYVHVYALTCAYIVCHMYYVCTYVMSRLALYSELHESILHVVVCLFCSCLRKMQMNLVPKRFEFLPNVG